MKIMLSILRRLVVTFLVTSVVFIVLSQIALRLLLPHADEQRQRLEQELSQFINADVSIERIDSHWNVLVPYIDLLNLKVSPNSDSSEQGSSEQLLNRLSIGLNLFDMFRAGSLAPSTLEVEGLNVVLAKREDGSFYFPGIELPDQQQQRSIDWDSVLSHKVVNVQNSRFQLRDEAKQETLDFQPINMRFFSGGGEYEGELSWRPPTALGQESKVTFDVKGVLEEPESWRGMIDVQIPQLKLKALKSYWPDSWGIDDGSLALQLGVKITDQGMTTQRGSIDVSTVLDGGKSLHWQSPIYVDAEVGKLTLEMSSPIMVDQKAILDGVAFEADFQNDLSVGLVVEKLEIARLIDVLNTLKPLPKPWPTRLQKMQMEGQLQNSFAGWDSINGWSARSQLRNFKNTAAGRIPGLSAFNADILFKDQKYMLSINEQALTVDTNGLFPKPFDVQRLHGNVNLAHDSDGWVLNAPSLFLNTKDVKTHSDLTLRFAKEKKPHLTLYAKAQDGQVISTANYVPTVLSEATLSWFRQAFLGGTVTEANAYISGYVNEIARNDSDAIFKIDGRINQGKLRYAKGWPIVEGVKGQLIMDGARLEVVAEQARTFNLRPRYAKAVMPNTRKSSLELTIKAPHSAMDGLLRYVNKSPISGLIGDSGKLFTGKGYADVVLDLKKNLSKKHYSDLNAYFSGKLRLQNASLNMSSLQLDFEKLKGFVDFSQKHVNADALVGTLNGQSFDSSIKTTATKKGPRAHLEMTTALSLQDVFKNKMQWLTQYAQGRPAWNVNLELPLSKGQAAPKVTAASRLMGLSMQLPYPLNKPLAEPMPVHASMQLTKAKRKALHISLDETLQGELIIDGQKGSIDAGNIRYRRGKAKAPRKGFVLDVDVDDVDVAAWLAIGEDAVKDVKAKQLLTGLQLSAKHAKYNSLTIDDLTLGGVTSANAWQLDLKAKGLAGQVVWPNTKKEAVSVNLNTLNLNDIETNNRGKSEPFDPAQLPAMDITVKQFQWDDIKLSNANVQLRPISSGLRIQSYKVNDPALNLKGEGAWQKNSAGQHESVIEFSASSKNAKQALAKVGVNKLLKRGNINLSGDLRWKGVPYQMHWASLNGNFKGHIQEGELLGVKPGAAKLLGLLNVESIPKRLALNFDDLNSKGFAFDKANMTVRLEDGIAHFDHMKIQASLADVYLEGRADLVNQELNQIAKVNPDVSNIMPVTAGVVGGLPGLVGALLVDRVVKALGGDTDRVAQVRYRITGNWNDPKVETTSVERVKDMTPEQLRKRAEDIVIKSQGVDYGQDVVPGELELNEIEEQQIFEP